MNQSKNNVKVERRIVFGICIFLAGVIWVVFGQTTKFGFINFDDDEYVYANPEVSQGLTLSGIRWAFTHTYSSNWHPLTWISHMMDCQFYGLKAGGHHFTNVFLHTLTTILLFLVLRRMTRMLWRSAFVAAIFAVHPLHVESVAWIAERKDVLSGLFFVLTIGAYVRYARRPWSIGRYGFVMLLYLLGLMCKPMLVTLPLVLVLLDYWPLNRFQFQNKSQPAFRFFGHLIPKRLILEKLPLIALAVASCAITIFAQTNSIGTFQSVPFHLRLGNSLISYAVYLRQMFWPSGLAILYPITSETIAIPEVMASLFLLIVISVAAYLLRRRCPYFVTGWLWYLIMLVPVIGILQVGTQARADRYTYLPQIGLYALLTWAAADLCAKWRHRRVILGGVSAIVLGALIFCAREQTSYWQNSETLWTHTIACTSGNFIAHYNLGDVLLQKGELDGAIIHFQKALEIRPDSGETYNNLGNALLQKGEIDEAMVQLQNALRYKPDDSEAYYNLGNALLQKNNVEEAIANYKKALQINPNDTDVQINLGNALLKNGKIDEAIGCYQKTLQIAPGYAEADYNLANAFIQKGNLDEAIVYYRKALQITPDSPAVLNNFAWLLATCSNKNIRNGTQAVKYASRACELTHYDDPDLVSTLAAACAQAGQFSNAVKTAQNALQLAEQADSSLTNDIQTQLKLYQANLPFVETNTNAF